MSVAEISEMHNRYVRLSDKFKAIWTYHQFAQGAFKNLVELPLPYNIDFQSIYQPIKNAQSVIQSATPESARELIEHADRDLKNVIRQLIQADESLSPSVMRRFFERLDKRDDKIIFYLIKFYFYSQRLGEVQIDKLDFLLTRIAEDYVEEREEYATRDALALRQTFQNLVAVRDTVVLPQEEILSLIGDLKELKREIERTEKFDDLSDQNLVGRLRELKRSTGAALFHPDVLLAVVQANIAMKNQTRRLYAEEETLILENAQRLLDNERNLKNGFAASDPAMSAELERFKEFKQKFDESRATSNLKFGALSRLKESMKNLLSDLEEEGSSAFDEVDPELEPAIDQADRENRIEEIFGDDPILVDHLLRIMNALAPWAERAGNASDLADDVMTELRLEKWEAEAWFRLSRNEDTEAAARDRDLLFMRAAALRLKINDVARELVHRIERGEVDQGFLLHIRSILAAAERLDSSFGTMIQGVGTQWSPDDLRRLHRSRIRLFREFSGLWLLYDQYLEENPGRHRS